MPSTRSRPMTRSLPFVVALLTGGATLAPLHAESVVPDTRAPHIELEALTESAADRSQVFTAQVSDDRALESVTLHHRRDGTQPFARATMSPLGDTGYYSVSLPTDPDDLRAIEYYVQALDGNGNRTVEGYAFDPFRRTLLPAAPLAVDGRNAEPAERTAAGDASLQRRWWAVALGIVAVGAIAALAGGGGSDDSGGGEGTVPPAVDAQEPDFR